MTEKEKQKKDTEKAPGIFSIIKSVLSAMIGIQNDDNRKRDFEQGNFKSFIVVGIIMVAIFVITLASIVNNILEGAVK